MKYFRVYKKNYISSNNLTLYCSGIIEWSAVEYIYFVIASFNHFCFLDFHIENFIEISNLNINIELLIANKSFNQLYSLSDITIFKLKIEKKIQNFYFKLMSKIILWAGRNDTWNQHSTFWILSWYLYSTICW